MALDLSALDDAPILEAKTAGKPADTAPKAPIGDFVQDNIRLLEEEDPEEFKAFVEDVRMHGILQPLICQRMPDGKLKIRFGHWRYRAGVELGLAELPYNVTEDPRQFTTYAQFSENSRRRPMTPLETALFIEARLAEGEKKKDIAQKMSIDASAVTHFLALANDPPKFIIELYTSRRCRSPVYLYELRKLHGKNAEIVERRCAEADEIDRRLLVAIADEIEPKALPPSAGPTDIRDVLDSQATGGGSAGGAGPEASSHEGSEAGAAVEVQHLPSHNPAIEGDSGGKAADPNKLKKPLLLGTYQGREVMIALTKRPTTAGLVFVKFEDGSGEEEVAIGEVTMTMLTDSHA